jgi:hypothetical protein
MMPNQASTRFSHDPEVGEVHVDARVRRQPVSDLDAVWTA